MMLLVIRLQLDLKDIPAGLNSTTQVNENFVRSVVNKSDNPSIRGEFKSFFLVKYFRIRL